MQGSRHPGIERIDPRRIIKQLENLKRIHLYNAVNLKNRYPLLEIRRLDGRFQGMSERTRKNFDSVQSTRQARDRLSAEIEGMSYDEMVRWFRGHGYTDRVLQGLAEKAAHQSAASDRTPAGR